MRPALEDVRPRKGLPTRTCRRPVPPPAWRAGRCLPPTRRSRTAREVERRSGLADVASRSLEHACGRLGGGARSRPANCDPDRVEQRAGGPTFPPAECFARGRKHAKASGAERATEPSSSERTVLPARTVQVADSLVLETVPLTRQPWPHRPFLFCVAPRRALPGRERAVRPDASRATRATAPTIAGVEGWRMYHVLRGALVARSTRNRVRDVTYVAPRAHLPPRSSARRRARARDTQLLHRGPGRPLVDVSPLLDAAAPNPLELSRSG